MELSSWGYPPSSYFHNTPSNNSLTAEHCPLLFLPQNHRFRRCLGEREARLGLVLIHSGCIRKLANRHCTCCRASLVIVGQSVRLKRRTENNPASCYGARITFCAGIVASGQVRVVAPRDRIWSTRYPLRPSPQR